MITNQVISVPVKSDRSKVEADTILRLMGHECFDEDDHFQQVVNQSLKEAQSIIKPVGGIVILNVEEVNHANGTITVDGTIFHVGKIITAQIKGSDKIALFTCTIGDQLEKHAKKLMDQSDLLEAYIFDLLGSEFAEETAENIQQQVIQMAKEEGLNTTNRFSPGYCNWSVSEQQSLFRFFGENPFNIQLGKSALMSPIKSVSGLIGIGSTVRFKPYSCNMCSDTHCIYRNKK